MKKYFKTFGRFIKHIEIIGTDQFDEFHMADLARNEPNPTQKFLVVLNLLAELVENDEITESMRNDGEEDGVSEFIVHCRANFTLP